jgi:hypothetical protein
MRLDVTFEPEPVALPMNGRGARDDDTDRDHIDASRQVNDLDSKKGQFMRVKHRSLVVLSLIGLAGCDQTTYLLDEVPRELLAVDADRSRFLMTDHPLEDIPAGTAMDDLSGLAGCWGRVASKSIEVDAETGEVLEYTILEVLEFQPESGRLLEHRIHGADLGFPILTGGLPMVQTFIASYQVESDSKVRRVDIDGRAGAIGPSGDVVFSYWPLVGIGISIGHEWDMLVTLDGDMLKTDERALNFVTSAESHVRLWVRLDCSDD